jgi:hypothetical protein
MSLILSAALTFASLSAGLLQAFCDDFRVTAYVRTEHSPWTYDGSSIYSGEPIVAASWDIPIDSVVVIDGLGTFRVADRGGGLGSHRWLDVAVWSRSEAFAITSPSRHACVYPPG